MTWNKPTFQPCRRTKIHCSKLNSNTKMQ